MKKKKGNILGWRGQILLIVGIILSVVFAAQSIILMIGMIPTIVLMIVDRSRGKIKTMTVGMSNFAGCVPFMAEVYKKGNEIGYALNYAMEPRTIVVMFTAAAVGYLIHWATRGVAAGIMAQRARARLKDIEKEKQKLIERWGIEVSGTIPLDEYGFPLEKTADDQKNNPDHSSTPA